MLLVYMRCWPIRSYCSILGVVSVMKLSTPTYTDAQNSVPLQCKTFTVCLPSSTREGERERERKGRKRTIIIAGNFRGRKLLRILQFCGSLRKFFSTKFGDVAPLDCQQYIVRGLGLGLENKERSNKGTTKPLLAILDIYQSFLRDLCCGWFGSETETN